MVALTSLGCGVGPPSMSRTGPAYNGRPRRDPTWRHLDVSAMNDRPCARPSSQASSSSSPARRFTRRVADMGGLPPLSLHGLRHTHATLLLADGIDAKTVSERLGHDSVQTTLELYGHVTATMRSNAAVRFGNLLDQSRARSLEIVTQR